MFNLKSIFAGVGAVGALYVGVFLFRGNSWHG